MRSTVRVFVIFYIGMTSYTTSCVSQTEVSPASSPANATTSTPREASTESTPGPDAEKTLQNVTAAGEDAEREEIPEPPVLTEWIDAGGKNRPHQFSFQTRVELNVKRLTRNEKCCGK